MKKVIKIILRVIVGIISVLVLLILAVVLFVNYYPSFGGDVSKERQAQYTSSEQFEAGVFKNKIDVPLDFSFSEGWTISRKFFFEKVKNGRPDANLKAEQIDSTNLANHKDGSRLMWFGHSAFLLQIDSVTILIDPMLGQVAAPHPWLGTNRFTKDLPLEIEKLPKVDVVVISHDHYDHLDYQSILKLKDKVGRFIVPLGVGVHLEAWGVDPNQIEELDWWEETSHEKISYICTPAQHFSGRKFSNGQTTLWSSWVIKSERSNLFFSGDSGYSEHFKEIGDKYGPFDLAMLECGQYNTMWPDIHMFPEETAQAGLDVGAKIIMPIHWGAFKLALHSWTDPVERVTTKAKELGIPVLIPKIGEIVKNPYSNYQNSDWWLRSKADH